jgi:hypothetical protein
MVRYLVNYLKEIESICHGAGILRVRDIARRAIDDARFAALGVNNNQEAKDFYGNNWESEADNRMI